MTITLKHKGQFLTISGKFDGEWMEIWSIEDGKDRIDLEDDLQMDVNDQAIQERIEAAADEKYDRMNDR